MFNNKSKICISRVGFLSACFLFVAALGNTAEAQREHGDVGVGIQFGSPSGLTVKAYTPRAMAFDLFAAWDLNDFVFLNAHGMYERHIGDSQNAHVFFGPGAFVGVRDGGNNFESESVIGVSGRVGLGFMIEKVELYGQVTPRLSVVPDSDTDIGGGVGFRYYF